MGKSNWRSFEEARVFVHQFQLKSKTEWTSWTKTDAKPLDIPTNPPRAYKDEGWNGWGDWLGTGTIAPFDRVYRPFKEARDFVRQLQLKSHKEWMNWTKTDVKPDDIPANPLSVYKDQGWESWGDWLGTSMIATQNRVYRPFEEARTFVHQLKLTSGKEWKDLAKTRNKPDDIPANPETVYKEKGWIGMGDWLGTGTVSPSNRVYKSFEEARAFVHHFKLKNQQEWAAWTKTEAKPHDIPVSPAGVYKDEGWENWGDWLGTGTVASQNRSYRIFEEARIFAQQLHLRNIEEWKNWTKTEAKPHDIPAAPDGVYKSEGWISWGDWLGTGTIANFNRTYRSFEEARAFVHQLKLKSQQEWKDWTQTNLKPDDIPAHPPRTYKDRGWIGWSDWLGIINLWRPNAILSFL